MKALQLYTQSMFVMLVWVAGEPYCADTWLEVERVIGRAHHRAKWTIDVCPRYSEGQFDYGAGQVGHFFGGLRWIHGRPFGTWDGVDGAYREIDEAVAEGRVRYCRPWGDA